MSAKANTIAATRDVTSDAELVSSTLAGDQAAWREMMRRYDRPLREAIADASLGPALDDADVDDALGEFWLSLIEADMRRLRMFNPTRGAALLSWLTIQLIQDLRRREQKRSTEPDTISLDEVDEIARTRRRLRPSTMMRVEEVAERWDLNVKTVYAMIARGELQARRFGRVMRVPRRVVESMEQASVVPERSVKSCR
jgi:excisionase family DNA binding protein